MIEAELEDSESSAFFLRICPAEQRPRVARVGDVKPVVVKDETD